MPLPNIIAGPILRRVDKNNVSVWIACSQNFHLTLKLYEGDNIKVSGATVTVPELTTTSAEATTVQFGKRLWIAVVTAKMQLPLQSGTIYSYNIHYKSPDTPSLNGDFKKAGLLSSEKHQGYPQEPIGYKKDSLPTFILPSDDVAELVIAQASCRKMHGHGQDALAFLDETIKTNLTNPSRRPQQLFLTGDQVYADDVPAPLLRFLGVHNGGVRLTLNESVKIDTQPNPAEIDVTNDNFPPLLRQQVITETAGMSSGSASSHVMSFGEFCALYLNYWCIRSWNLELIESLKRIQTDNKDSVLEQEARNLLDSTQSEHNPNLKSFYEPLRQSSSARSFTLHFDKDSNARYQLNPVDIKQPDKQTERFNQWLESVLKHLKGNLEEMAAFTKVLPKVSRVLANIPSYMIFDDHEVTDDWYLSQRWKNHVLSKHLGRDITRNGMMAYCVFQDWGNTPDDYVAIPQTGENTANLTPRTQLLRKISDYCFDVARDTPVANLRSTSIEDIENLLGMSDQPAEVKWHYNVNSGAVKSYVLDTRTRREYATLNSPPGLLSEAALADQVPDSPDASAPFTFVVSAAPVLGLGSFEELIQPAYASVKGISGKTGRNPGILEGMLAADYEAWGFNTKSFELFIQRLSKLKKVILLSGDVHYGFSAALDYWKGNSTDPEARILQFTSSALKNEEAGIVNIYRSAVAQKLLTGIGDNLEKMGWNNRSLSVTGEVSIKNRHRLRQNPAVIPVEGWHPGSRVNRQPDYRWRLKMLTDNSTRTPDPITSDVTPAEDSSHTATREFYEKIVQRHQQNFISGVHRRMVWPCNVGLLKFENASGGIKVKHDFLFIQNSRSGPEKTAKAHIKHEILLVTSGAETSRPELP